METDFKKICKIVGPIMKNRGVVFAFLFGSRATGTARESSDFDFAVSFPKKFSSEKRFKLRLRLMGELSAALKADVEVVVFEDVRSLFFKFIITKNGRVVLGENSLERIFFELKLMNEYHDFSRFLDEFDKMYINSELKKQ